MSLGTLALIGICGLCGPLLSAGARGAIPAVVGEILARVVIGNTGFHALDTSNPTRAVARIAITQPAIRSVPSATRPALAGASTNGIAIVAATSATVT